MKIAILFDLGNTLAAYYRREEFPPILERCVARVRDRLQSEGIETVPLSVAVERASTENREAADFRFNPMAPRLARIFDLAPEVSGRLGQSLCETFLGPIFEVGRLYDETVSVLQRLRDEGYATAIVSNAPWGSPPASWRRELGRLGLADLIDEIVLCGDVGWRKPAEAIFRHAAVRLGVECGSCVFVGDDLEWDISGSAAVGMRPVLIDREDRFAAYQGVRIRALSELAGVLAMQDAPSEGVRHG